jgi:hypothetical protein
MEPASDSHTSPATHSTEIPAQGSAGEVIEVLTVRISINDAGGSVGEVPRSSYLIHKVGYCRGHRPETPTTSGVPLII